MVTREYICRTDGYFTVQRSIASSTKEVCPICSVNAERVYIKPPTFGIKGGSPTIPSLHSTSESEYEGWQRDKWQEYTEKLHPDNAGSTTKLDVKSLTGYNAPTPIPDIINN